MRIALAQIDMRLGDIEGICARIESQARIARDQGADLLVTPAPLFGGTAPGGLIEERNYEHALLSALADLAGRLAALGIDAVVPAPVSVEHMPVLEAFLLREGRTVPLRSLYASRRTGSLEEMWFPPVFEVAGTRIAVTYDPARDMPVLAPGCDLVLFPLASSFDAADEATAAVASLADGHTVGLAREKGVWLACLAPVGAFDEAAAQAKFDAWKTAKTQSLNAAITKTAEAKKKAAAARLEEEKAINAKVAEKVAEKKAAEAAAKAEAEAAAAAEAAGADAPAEAPAEA